MLGIFFFRKVAHAANMLFDGPLIMGFLANENTPTVVTLPVKTRTT